MPPKDGRDEFAKLYFPKVSDKRVERGPVIGAQLRRTENLWNEWWVEQEQHEARKPTENDFIAFFRRMKRADKINFPKDPRLQQQTVRDFMDYLNKDSEADFHYLGSHSKRLLTMDEEEGKPANRPRWNAKAIYELAKTTTLEQFSEEMSMVFGIKVRLE